LSVLGVSPVQGCRTFWHSGDTKTFTVYNDESCYKFPGDPAPVGMEELCLYTKEQYGYFRFQGQDWWCLRLASKELGGSKIRRVVWKEWICDENGWYGPVEE